MGMGSAGFAVCSAVLFALGCKGMGSAPRSNTAPSLETRDAQAPASVAPPLGSRAVEHAQLFMVGQTPSLSFPIIFDNRAFLQVYGSWVAIEGNRLRAAPESEYRVGVSAETPLLDATGKFPEQAWLLTAHDGNPQPPLRWTRDRWLPISGADDLPGFGVSNVALCRWGGRHLLLRSQPDRAGALGRSSFQVLDESGSPPRFARADSAVSARCETRLVAESCFPLSDGGLVVLGPACGLAHAQALEYFGPTAANGVPVELPRGHHQQVWISSGSSSGGALYLGGWLGEREAPYLALITSGGHVEELEVPAFNDAIERVATDSDGSVWLDAPLRGNKVNFDGQALWRRSASGSWTHPRIESRIADLPGWFVSCCGFGLFSAAGGVWLEATYTHSGGGKGDEGALNLLYSNRATQQVRDAKQ